MQAIGRFKTTTTKTTPVYWPFIRDYPGEPVQGKTNLDLLEQETVSGNGIS